MAKIENGFFCRKNFATKKNHVVKKKPYWFLGVSDPQKHPTVIKPRFTDSKGLYLSIGVGLGRQKLI